MSLLSRSLLRSSQGKTQLISDINVTPFVDVMLVLLIIFMATAPLVAAGVDVDLPQQSAGRLVSDAKPIEISIDEAGQVHIDKLSVPADALVDSLAQLANSNADPATARVFVRADRRLDYGFVMGIVSQVSSVGFTKVAFLTDPDPTLETKGPR